MNVLFLSTIRSGSSLLQRNVALYMNFHSDQFNKPIIDLSNLDQGFIDSYYSNTYNQQILRNDSESQDVSQPLSNISQLINESDHYVTGRITYHHMEEYRTDSHKDKQDFIKFLNDNFCVVQCQRESVFEFALSYGIKQETALTNTWLHTEKVESCSKLFKDKVRIPTDSFIRYLDRYKNYIEWSEREFDISDTYIYERDMPTIDSFIQNLSFFKNHNFKSWEEMFGISWQEWNKCHRLQSDVVSVNDIRKLEFNNTSTNERKNNSLVVAHSLRNLPAIEQEFVSKNALKYLNVTNTVEKLTKEKELNIGISLKLQTLVEKAMIVENFKECARVYNDWADKNDYPIIESNEEVINQAYNELKHWYESVPSSIKMLNLLD